MFNLQTCVIPLIKFFNDSLKDVSFLCGCFVCWMRNGRGGGGLANVFYVSCFIVVGAKILCNRFKACNFMWKNKTFSSSSSLIAWSSPHISKERKSFAATTKIRFLRCHMGRWRPKSPDFTFTTLGLKLNVGAIFSSRSRRYKREG